MGWADTILGVRAVDRFPLQVSGTPGGTGIPLGGCNKLGVVRSFGELRIGCG